MKPLELLEMIDKGMVEELTMYYYGKRSVISVHNIPEVMPNYEISKIWNSENGKGISVLLADNMENETFKKCANCRHSFRLKHNFKVGVGHEESMCCRLFAYGTSKDCRETGFILEVDPEKEYCECFEGV